MRRKNETLDSIAYIINEIDRLYARIPEDTSEQDDLYLRIVRGLKNSLENLQNLVELEED
ncbi:hypothetical protein HOE22_08570 [Candidatus Woesearchaeota archaeon]|jgi:hypothetical protein|nr:hypothetical protein [Candidatus Woesearchaeota archaeon]